MLNERTRTKLNTQDSNRKAVSVPDGCVTNLLKSLNKIVALLKWERGQSVQYQDRAWWWPPLWRWQWTAPPDGWCTPVTPGARSHNQMNRLEQHSTVGQWIQGWFTISSLSIIADHHTMLTNKKAYYCSLVRVSWHLWRCWSLFRPCAGVLTSHMTPASDHMSAVRPVCVVCVSLCLTD